MEVRNLYVGDIYHITDVDYESDCNGFYKEYTLSNPRSTILYKPFVMIPYA